MPVEAQSSWSKNVVSRLFLFLAEMRTEYVKRLKFYVIFTGDHSVKADVIGLFDEFKACKENMIDLKA